MRASFVTPKRTILASCGCAAARSFERVYTGLFADRLPSITDRRLTDARLWHALQPYRAIVASIERTEPILEGVFLSLAQ